MQQILPHLYNKTKKRFDESFAEEKMSNLVAANVNFNKHDRRYLAGETIHGLLSIECPSNVEISSLFISLRGETNVSWHDMLKKQSSNQTELKIKEDYTHVFEKTRHHSLEKITEIPFNFELSADLPSTIESEYGFTRYDCIVQIECNRNSSEEKKPVAELFEFPFTVTARAPVRDDQTKMFSKTPVRCEHTIELGSLTGPPEEIVIRFSIQKDHFTGGETIDAVIHVENKTYYHTIHQIGVALVQNIRCSAGSHVKTETKIIASQKVGPNLEHGKAEEIVIALQVPNNLLPTQEGQMITIEYQVEIIGDEDHLKSKTFIPIKIF